MSETNNGWSGVTIERNPAVAEYLRRFQEDYLWCLNQVDLRQRYENRVVALHNREVIGSGETNEEAREAARQTLQARGKPFPPEHDVHLLILPPMAWLDSPLAAETKASTPPPW